MELRLKGLSLLIFCILASVDAMGQYYKTLPQNVRVFGNKYIKSKVSASFNRTQTETPYAIKFDATSENLSKIDNAQLQEALDLFRAYPDVYKDLSLGNHKIDGSAQVTVNAYYLGYGISNKVMAYIGIPLYDAKVNVRYKRSSSSTNDKVAEELQKK